VHHQIFGDMPGRWLVGNSYCGKQVLPQRVVSGQPVRERKELDINRSAGGEMESGFLMAALIPTFIH